MRERWLNVPNVITLARLAAVPAVGWLIHTHEWAAASAVFLVAALSDGLDGFLARSLGQTTKIGAALDPVADKALGIVTLVMLSLEGEIPWWVTLAILTRDTVIVLGALSYRRLAGQLEIRPTRLGKAHTFAEFALLLLVLGALAGWLQPGGWIMALFVGVTAIALASGAQYVWIWWAKARRERVF